jgi:hypothetical protein
MYRISHCYRAIIHTALAVLVLAALSRCSWEESRELEQWMNTLAVHRLALPTPMQAPVHDCDRESGCICRGAKLVVALNVNHCQAQPAELLPPQLNDLLTYIADLSAESQRPPDLLDSAPPISGRQLRALYASLVI